jgi:hypothetical protein
MTQSLYANINQGNKQTKKNYCDNMSFTPDGFQFVFASFESLPFLLIFQRTGFYFTASVVFLSLISLTSPFCLLFPSSGWFEVILPLLFLRWELRLLI